jgi:hypothetical protein
MQVPALTFRTLTLALTEEKKAGALGIQDCGLLNSLEHVRCTAIRLF